MEVVSNGVALTSGEVYALVRRRRDERRARQLPAFGLQVVTEPGMYSSVGGGGGGAKRTFGRSSAPVASVVSKATMEVTEEGRAQLAQQYLQQLSTVGKASLLVEIQVLKYLENEAAPVYGPSSCYSASLTVINVHAAQAKRLQLQRDKQRNALSPEQVGEGGNMPHSVADMQLVHEDVLPHTFLSGSSSSKSIPVVTSESNVEKDGSANSSRNNDNESEAARRSTHPTEQGNTVVGEQPMLTHLLLSLNWVQKAPPGCVAHVAAVERSLSLLDEYGRQQELAFARGLSHVVQQMKQRNLLKDTHADGTNRKPRVRFDVPGEGQNTPLFSSNEVRQLVSARPIAAIDVHRIIDNLDERLAWNDEAVTFFEQAVCNMFIQARDSLQWRNKKH